MARLRKEHEECHKDERWLGNMRRNKERPYLAGLKTLRLGNVAYDIHGKRLPEEYAPIFINKKEYWEYDRIMVERCHR